MQPILSKKFQTGVQYVNLCHHQKQQWYALTAYLFQIHNFCQFFFSLSPSFMRKTAKSIVWTITHRNHVEVSDVWCENLKVMFNLRYIILFFFPMKWMIKMFGRLVIMGIPAGDNIWYHNKLQTLLGRKKKLISHFIVLPK